MVDERLSREPRIPPVPPRLEGVRRTTHLLLRNQYDTHTTRPNFFTLVIQGTRRVYSLCGISIYFKVFAFLILLDKEYNHSHALHKLCLSILSNILKAMVHSGRAVARDACAASPCVLWQHGLHARATTDAQGAQADMI